MELQGGLAPLGPPPGYGLVQDSLGSYAPVKIVRFLSKGYVGIVPATYILIVMMKMMVMMIMMMIIMMIILIKMKIMVMMMIRMIIMVIKMKIMIVMVALMINDSGDL